jgi:serine/threonine-protein kinase
MAVPSLDELIQQLSTGPLLSAERKKELPGLRTSCADARALARELVQRGWLTPYQVNQLIQGRGQDLILGPYVLQERLGEGGMGTVFKAHQTFLNRPVALKLIVQAHLGNRAAAERFLLEMQLVAQLDHPHIVRALDAGQVGDRYYLAMELIQGHTLTRLVEQRGPLPVGWACACIRQAALGLQHASESGLVHRDIKPSNLMLATPRGSAPVVKVLDLGLARPQGAESTRDLTRTGTLMGTMDYLAPEQALDPRGVDVRADIYSLGCTFFFLLSGRPPFHGGTEAQKLLQHQQQEPPAIEGLRAEVSPAVASLLRRMLAKRPEQRFATPGELAAALEPFASWEGWQSGAVSTAVVPGNSGSTPSLIDNRAASAERGWTLMAEPSLARPAAPASTAAAPPMVVPTAHPDASFGIPLSSAGLSVAQAAPSLVSERAITPEKGWTLLAESAPTPATGFAAVEAPAHAAPRTGERFSPRTWRIIAAVAALLLLLLIGVLVLSGVFRSSSREEPIAHNPPVKGGDKKPPQGDGDKKEVNLDKKQPGEDKKQPGEDKKQPGEDKKRPDEDKKQPVKEKIELPVEGPVFKGIRPVVIKPGQPLGLPRTGDVVFPAYASGYIAMGDRMGADTFLVWDLTTMKEVGRFQAVSGMDHPRALSTDGRWLAGKVGGQVRICEAKTGKVATLAVPEGRVDWLGFAGLNRLVTMQTGGAGCNLQVWDLATQKLLFSRPLPAGCAGTLAVVSPDGRHLVAPGANLIIVQELKEDAAATVLSLPKQRGSFAPNCRRVAYAEDGKEVAALIEDTFMGWRIATWDFKKSALKEEHVVPDGSFKAPFFYPREGPAIEWLPGHKGWFLFGQGVIEARTGALRGVLGFEGPAGEHRQPLRRILTAEHAVEVTATEVRIIPLPAAKGK